MKFELAEASLLDTSDLVRIHCEAWKDNDLWRLLMSDVSSSDEHDWLAKGFGRRNSLPDRKVYKITDHATGKLVAFTCLTVPYTLNEEQMSLVKDEEPPPLGHNSSLATEFFERLEAAKKHGYDPKKDYHRKGTMVHTDYQRKGLGSLLTRHCNEIADKTGGRTFVIARSTSKNMFESHGFRVLGSEDLNMTKYGGDENEGKAWVLVREPHKSGGLESWQK